MRRVALVTIACVAACAEPGTALRLSIDSEAPLTTLSLALLRDADAGVENHLVPPDGTTPVLPGVFVVALGGADADVSVSLRGLTAANEVLVAEGSVHCVAHHSCELAVMLRRPRAPNGAGCATDDDCATGVCAAGVCCDRACDGLCETCAASDGAPADGTCGVRTSGTLCRASVGPCDVDDTCDGTSPDCADIHAGIGVVCRPAVSACDVAELCDGVTGTCPADLTLCPAGKFCSKSGCAAPQANGNSCTDGVMCSSGFCVGGVCCDQACTGGCESCSAPNGACHTTMGNVCRASTGPCDPAEICDGTSKDCPPDQKAPENFTTYVPDNAGTGSDYDVPSDPETLLSTGCAGVNTNVGHLFATFDTPVMFTAPVSVQLVGCLTQGTGAATVGQVSFELPLDRAAYGTPQGNVTPLPASNGQPHVEITTLSPSFVGGHGGTQVMLENTEPCSKEDSKDLRVYSSNAACGTTSRLQLVVGVCLSSQ
jgi:hypothetical protein